MGYNVLKEEATYIFYLSIFIHISICILLIKFFTTIFLKSKKLNHTSLSYISILLIIFFIYLLVSNIIHLFNPLRNSNEIISTIEFYVGVLLKITFFIVLLKNTKIDDYLKNPPFIYRIYKTSLILSIIFIILDLLFYLGYVFFKNNILTNECYSNIFSILNNIIFILKQYLIFFIGIYNTPKFIDLFTSNKIENPNDRDWLKFAGKMFLVILGYLIVSVLIIKIFDLLSFGYNFTIYSGFVLVGLSFFTLLIFIINLLAKKLWKKVFVVCFYIILIGVIALIKYLKATL